MINAGLMAGAHAIDFEEATNDDKLVPIIFQTDSLNERLFLNDKKWAKKREQREKLNGR